MNLPPHGANPLTLYETVGMKPPVVMKDFSANINPLGPPAVLQENWSSFYDSILEYPDPKANRLKTFIAEREGLEPGQVLVGNGGAELISLIGRLLAGKKAVIVQPAFSEYEAACRANSCQVEHYFMKQEPWGLEIEGLKEKIRYNDALFLCNPNNPTGMHFSAELVMQLMEECRRNNCLFIIDEAFYDFLEAYESLVPAMKNNPNIILLRSMTKIFAIPGIRLGYLLADSRIIESIASYQPHWSVNAIAQHAGMLCLENSSHVQLTVDYISAERKRLFSFYQKNGLIFSPSSINFYLLRDPSEENKESLFHYLMGAGLVPRHTVNFPGLDGRWLRFAIKREEDNTELMERIEKWWNRTI
ncbi:threonine-phosphate decarboxylase CobD [Bacillus massilinigeriensis]|uniref:threonine-phosphate decarboxylase CobD n=1 Tax=Bacillus mediterraneensis TaxID=1805474 RepID=UPI00093C5BAC|nr:threonine-phosphate decarboxylase CobD [Bacillus mediterraneensis]